LNVAKFGEDQICTCIYKSSETVHFLSTFLLCGTVCNLTCAQQTSRKTFGEKGQRRFSSILPTLTAHLLL